MVTNCGLYNERYMWKSKIYYEHNVTTLQVPERIAFLHSIFHVQHQIITAHDLASFIPQLRDIPAQVLPF